MKGSGYSEFLDLRHIDFVSDALAMSTSDYPKYDLFPDVAHFFTVKSGVKFAGVQSAVGLFITNSVSTCRILESDEFSVDWIRANFRRMSIEAQEVVRDTLALYTNPTRFRGIKDVCLYPRLGDDLRALSNLKVYVDSVVISGQWNCFVPSKRAVYFVDEHLVDRFAFDDTFVYSREGIDPYKKDVVTSRVQKKMSNVSVPWGSVDFADEQVVEAYMSVEYGEHVRSCMQILSVLNYERVCAPCDGPGVVAEACDALGIECLSGDLSEAMCKRGELNGYHVVREDYRDTLLRAKDCDLIMLNHCVRDCPQIVGAALETGLPIIVITHETTFLGRSRLQLYAETSNVYVYDVVLRDVRFTKRRKMTCRFVDFFNEKVRYHVDNPIAYDLMRSFLIQGFNVRISVDDMKFAEGFRDVVKGDFGSTYLFYHTVRFGFAGYVDMLTGLYSQSPFVLLDKDLTLPPSALVVSPGSVAKVKSLVSSDALKVFRASNGLFTVSFKGVRTFRIRVERRGKFEALVHDKDGPLIDSIFYDVPPRLANRRAKREAWRSQCAIRKKRKKGRK